MTPPAENPVPKEQRPLSEWTDSEKLDWLVMTVAEVAGIIDGLKNSANPMIRMMMNRAMK